MLRYPALVAKQYPEVIVVGSVDNNGLEFPSSQHGPLVSVWAPGADVVCASNVGTGSQTLSGTSMAAGMVSGLAAYYLSLYPSLQKPGTGLTSRLVQSRLKSTSWSRGPTPGFMKAVWNGLSSPVCPALPVVGRRDGGDAAFCPASLTPSSTLSSVTKVSPTTEIPSSTPIPSCHSGWYDEPKTCSQQCLDGTCTPVREKFRRRCLGCVAPEPVYYECKCS